ncbi:isochorismatase family protein [Paraburkholderia ferrariae]|uniref:isochorismatase family protein n=1 Tax=Paraburkholderia ferrariae TaxID=386056 RepID=UPI0006937301|nr:isochorismatase family protein [Paraburkholderia ferrariae]
MTLPPDWTELVPKLEAHPDDYRVTKHRWGAFHGMPLDAFLRERGVTRVVLTGVATSMGVESTARNAHEREHERGYNVALVVDAMTDLDIEAHRYSVEKIFSLLGETTTTAEVLARLDGDPAR